MADKKDTPASPRRRQREPEFVCCICSEPYVGIGHDPLPISDKGECCDVCRLVSVLPYREAELPPRPVLSAATAARARLV